MPCGAKVLPADPQDSQEPLGSQGQLPTWQAAYLRTHAMGMDWCML